MPSQTVGLVIDRSATLQKVPPTFQTLVVNELYAQNNGQNILMITNRIEYTIAETHWVRHIKFLTHRQVLTTRERPKECRWWVSGISELQIRPPQARQRRSCLWRFQRSSLLRTSPPVYITPGTCSITIFRKLACIIPLHHPSWGLSDRR